MLITVFDKLMYKNWTSLYKEALNQYDLLLSLTFLVELRES